MLKVIIGVVEGAVLIAIFVIPWNAASYHFDEKTRKFTKKGKKLILLNFCLVAAFIASFLLLFPVLKSYL